MATVISLAGWKYFYRKSMAAALTFAILGGAAAVAGDAVRRLADAMQRVKPFDHVKSHTRFNGGRPSGTAAARRAKRRRLNIAKHPRGAA